MDKYSVSDISKNLNISKSTLRYYDKLGIISSGRSENNYRYYTDEDIMSIKYIQVMKYSGLSLSEIQIILKNKNSESGFDDIKCIENTLELLGNKKIELLSKIEHFKRMIEIIDIASVIIKSKNSNCDFEKVDELINYLYDNINNNNI